MKGVVDCPTPILLMVFILMPPHDSALFHSQGTCRDLGGLYWNRWPDKRSRSGEGVLIRRDD